MRPSVLKNARAILICKLYISYEPPHPKNLYKFFWFRSSFDALKPQFGYNCVPRAVSKFDETFSLIHVPPPGKYTVRRAIRLSDRGLEELKMLTPPVLSDSFFTRLMDVKRCSAFVWFFASKMVEHLSKRVSWILFLAAYPKNLPLPSKIRV